MTLTLKLLAFFLYISFSSKPCLIFHIRKAPSPLGAATSERELGIWVSVWVGRSVASGLDHADLVFSLTQAYF